MPLATAPLARVLAQVRFPEVQSVQNKSFVAPFQERIRKLYPRTVSDTLNGFVIGSPQLVSTNIWRYLDADGWRVSLSDSFISIETTKYTSRKDFTSRFRFLLQQLAETVGPTHTNRIGIRYVDQVLLEENESMSGMLRKEMIGVKDIFGKTHHMISELEGASKEGGATMTAFSCTDAAGLTTFVRQRRRHPRWWTCSNRKPRPNGTSRPLGRRVS
ncbi:TIGR04255 family protein [Sinorhizobium sp. 8-89]|uniref:TIGR04255 family protein n=1 Tax=Sinorhizobium sp. 7-81 TaxID=3049087 RepID=UPI0024C4274C|nr:TIGR04255 family protein [Sinorhizobium sp. 7-81]